jgi:hypothetical protein
MDPKGLSFFRPFAAHDAGVERYESLHPEEVAAELREAGIDPGPAIKAVTELVRSRLSRWTTREGTAAPAITALSLAASLADVIRESS